MAAAIGEPTTDPHGAPIPTREGTLDDTPLRALDEIGVGDRVTVQRVGRPRSGTASLSRGARDHARPPCRSRVACALRRPDRASRRQSHARDRRLHSPGRSSSRDSLLGMIAALALAVAFQQIDSSPPARYPRTIAVDERLAADAGVRLGDTLVVSRARRSGRHSHCLRVCAAPRRSLGGCPRRVSRADAFGRVAVARRLRRSRRPIRGLELGRARQRTARCTRSTPRPSVFTRTGRATSRWRRRARFSS